MTYTPNSFKKRPKDGSKNKVLNALMDPRLSSTGLVPSRPPTPQLGTGIFVVKSQWWQNTVGSHPLDMRLNGASSNQQCGWHVYTSQLRGMLYEGNNDYPIGSLWPNRQIDHYHMLAHVMTPDDVAMHGTEFVMNLVALCEEFKLGDCTKAESKKLIKTILLENKVETVGDDIAWMKFGDDGRLYAIKRNPRPPKSDEKLVKELLDMQKMLEGLHVP